MDGLWVGRGGLLNLGVDPDNVERTHDAVPCRIERHERAVGKPDIVSGGARVEVAAQNGLFYAATTCHGRYGQQERCRQLAAAMPRAGDSDLGGFRLATLPGTESRAPSTAHD